MPAYEIHPLLIKRRSIFSFSDTPVDEEILQILFDAARKAPSSNNAQPWKFIYSGKNNSGLYKIMFDLLNEGNKIWANSASVLILSLTDKIFQHNGKPNFYAFHDLGLATANLMIQATFMGLATHPMGGFDREKAKKILNIPENLEPAVMIALGYPGTSENLSQRLRDKELNAGLRKEVEEFTFKGEFKNLHLA